MLGEAKAAKKSLSSKGHLHGLKNTLNWPNLYITFNNFIIAFILLTSVIIIRRNY